ncbi:hypothetical protein TRSC58_00862 [Trypanosoma rangeli SC58]|uniref:WW domain-containing protein n=1 Tax=Trypanosoma rangeli SC58 TaxID=429131 RepID=A0A061J902_TRYRA|nr:hypothetical protein TRSC58_00862 [Trypanosoma rangeli SC58]
MSRRGFPVHRERSPENVEERSSRPRTENRMPVTELGVPLLQSADEISEEALYALMCPNDGEPLPPGWEKVVYHGTVVYLDHVAREAHEVRPWEVWRRRSEAAR